VPLPQNKKAPELIRDAFRLLSLNISQFTGL
jgi:hypothetical protein